MKPWSLMPNAHHIDWVIKSLKTAPHIWYNVQIRNDILARLNAFMNAWTIPRPLTHSPDEAPIANRKEIWKAAERAAWHAARNVPENEDWHETELLTSQDFRWISARYAIMTLIAYDDCDQYLNMTYEQLKVYVVLSEKPQALLLLSLKWVQENESLVASV